MQWRGHMEDTIGLDTLDYMEDSDWGRLSWCGGIENFHIVGTGVYQVISLGTPKRKDKSLV